MAVLLELLELHECTVSNGADGNDGVWLTCSCGWASDQLSSPTVARIAAEAAAHEREARRTDEGSVAAARAGFMEALLAAGFRRSADATPTFDRGALRVWVYWDDARLGTTERGRSVTHTGPMTFEEALARVPGGLAAVRKETR